ncbi:hypothetical protein Tco_0986054, partial [Tanacetum coccineum]
MVGLWYFHILANYCWELNTSELVLPRDELVLLSQQLVLLEENSSYCLRLQLPVLNQSVNTARITTAGEKVNAAKSLLIVSTEVNADYTNENGEMEITATIDGRVKTVTKATIRRHLKLEDSDGISTLPNTEIFEQLA